MNFQTYKLFLKRLVQAQ